MLAIPSRRTGRNFFGLLLVISLAITFSPQYSVQAGTPMPDNLRLPWAYGSFRINGGNTYDCGTHTGYGPGDGNNDKYAIDFALQDGIRVAAVADGEAYSSTHSALGTYVWVVHAGGWVSRYAHLQSTSVPLYPAHTPVKQGQVIGISGSSGTNDPHLHFSLRRDATNQWDGWSHPPKLSGWDDFNQFGFNNERCNWSVSNLPISHYYTVSSPGGWWIGPTPSDGSNLTYGSNLALNFRAVDNGNGGLKKVDVTVSYDGGSTWSIKYTKTFSTYTAQSDVYYEMPITASWLRVGINVYSNNDGYQLSPNGVRNFCTTYVPCPTSGSSGDPGGGAGGGGVSDGVMLCDSTNYTGQCQTFTEGKYQNLADRGWYDRAESVRFVGSYIGNYHVVLHSEINLGGDPYHADADVSELDNAHRNHIRSLEIYRHERTGIELCDGENYGGECKFFAVQDPEGKYPDLNTVGFYDRAESVRFLGACAGGNRCHAVLHSEKDFQGDPGHYDNDASTLGNAQKNHVRSVTVYKHKLNGIELCDGENYGGECKFFAVQDPEAKYADLNSFGFYDRAESVRFVGDCSSGRCHAVLHSEKDFQGDPGHYDNDASTLGNAQRNHVRSVTLYRHRPPQAPNLESPPDYVTFNEGENITLRWTANSTQYLVEIWNGPNGLETFGWQNEPFKELGSLAAGYSYSWRVRGRNQVGEGQWSSSRTFTVQANTPPPSGMTFEDFQDGDVGWNTIGSVTNAQESSNQFRRFTPPSGSSAESARLVNTAALADYNAISVRINTHGASLLGNDASALYLNQGGWKYVALSEYIQEGLDAWQTVEIPLADFAGFNKATAFSQLGFRFWVNTFSTIDIDDIQFITSAGNIPTPTPTPTPTPAPLPTPPSGMTFEDFQDGDVGWNTIGSVTNAQESSNQFRRFTPPSGSSAESARLVNTAALADYNAISVRINTHGASLLGNDASALYLNQGGWKYVALSEYIQQGLNAWQTVEIPLTDFVGFNKATAFSQLGFRFWVPSAATIDIDDITFVPGGSGGTTPITQSFIAVEDAYADSSRPTTVTGAETGIGVDGDPVKVGYLKFNLSSLAGKTITAAKLRMYVTNSSGDVQTLREVTTNTWSEGSLTWNNRPALSSTPLTTIDTHGVLNQWVEVDLTQVVQAHVGGTYSLGIDETGPDSLIFNASESSSNPVALVITYQDGAPPIGSPTTQSFVAVEDSYVDASRPTGAYGREISVGVDADPLRDGYLKFDLTSLAGKTVTSAKLRLYITNPSVGTQALYEASSAWDEDTLTWNNRPAFPQASSDWIGTINTGNTANQWVEVTITSSVQGHIGSIYGLGIDTTDGDGININAHDGASNPPQLVVTYQ